MQKEVYPATDLKKTCQEVASNPKYESLKPRHNYWADLGKDPEVVEKRIDEIWTSILHDPKKGFTIQTAPDELVFYDTGNTDVRTEGQSYGMLCAVMLDDKTVFDYTWNWTLRHMYMEEGPIRGYFRWSVPLDGREKAQGPAPDGEEFFIWALIFADKRWGSGEGNQNYAGWAKRLLRDVLHRNEGEAGPLFQANNLIEFVPDCGETDPSYHLPHAYEIFSEYAGEDKERWMDIARASRDFLPRAAHEVTGLFPEFSLNDGSPFTSRGKSNFYSDAYRCLLNLAVDASWNGDREYQTEIAKKQAHFFAQDFPKSIEYRYELDGTKTGEPSLHPVGLLATLATSRVLLDNHDSNLIADHFWKTDLHEGDRRYYDNFLYLFSFLVLAGRYSL